MPRFSPAQVQRYYDRQTPGFVALGQGGDVGAIHRAVWGPGTRDRREAFHYVEDRIVECIRRLPGASGTTHTPHVVDLGCGLGASLCYLAEQLPIRCTGITLSPVQAELAARRVQDKSLSGRVVCVSGDYCDLPAGIGTADFAYAIESFVHAPDPPRFFGQCRKLLRPGGMLAICDDVARPAGGPIAGRTIEQFRSGWHINALLERHELRALAQAAGFEHDSTVDLSPFLEIQRPRDRAISALLALFGWLPLERTAVGHVVGGAALQTCLKRGWIGYELALFRRSG